MTKPTSGDLLIRATFYTRFFKLFLDRLAALLMLIVLSPVLLVLALLVKCTSRGPVFFRQRRIGLNKAEFNILKFRTMYVDAPGNVPTHMLQNAKSFITPVGRFYRKSSLDELPQLINIIRGEMSFIGPRPALWNQYDLIAERDKYSANAMLPGVTGWAQVEGRDELPIPEKAAKDGYYATHASFPLDVKILVRTAVNVLSARGVVEGAAAGDRK